MKIYIRFPVIFLLLVAVIGAACSSSAMRPSTPEANALPPTEAPVPASNSGGIDACAALLKSDAETILGGPVGEAEHPLEGAETFIVTSCAYRLQSDSMQKVSLIITVPANGDLQSAQSAFDMDKSQAQTMLNATPVDVPGVGDSAYWAGGLANQLGILKGAAHLILTVSTQKGDTPPQPVIDLGQTLLGRLP